VEAVGDLERLCGGEQTRGEGASFGRRRGRLCVGVSPRGARALSLLRRAREAGRVPEMTFFSVLISCAAQRQQEPPRVRSAASPLLI